MPQIRVVNPGTFTIGLSPGSAAGGTTTATSTRLEDDRDDALLGGALEDARELPLRACAEHLAQEHGAQSLALIAVFEQEATSAIVTTWLRERRPSTAALLERGDTFSDDLDSPSIRAIQAIYSAAMFEELKMFQVVDKLVALFRGGALPLGRGEGADKLRQYGERATRRLPESERRAVYQRALGIGAEKGIDANREFDTLWREFLSAVKATPGPGAGASQESLRNAGQSLASNLSFHGYGMAYVAATELQSHLRDMLDLLSDREIQSATGARDMWQVIELVATRDLGGAANTARLRTLQSSGATILRWLAARAGGLARASSAPVLDLDEIAHHVTRSPGGATPRATTIWSRRWSGGSPLPDEGYTICRDTWTAAVHWNVAAGKTQGAGPQCRQRGGHRKWP